jgi:integrase
MIKSNPFAAIPRQDIQPQPYEGAQAMDGQTFEKILNVIPDDAIGLRDKAILLFFAYTGRRRAEVAKLRVKDLQVRREPYSYQVRVKGNRLQRYELPEICWKAISDYWVLSDRLHSLTPESGVFTADVRIGRDKHYGDAPLSNRMMNKILRRAAKAAGVEGEPGVKIHGLRHMAARDLNRAGVRLQDIQAFLGHASPTTTQIYLGKLSGPAPAHEEVLKAVRAAARDAARAAQDEMT